MKNIAVSLLLLLTFFSFSGCGEKEEPRPDYRFSFKVDGVLKEFSATKDAGIVFLENGPNRVTLFTMVSGNNPSQNSIVMSFRNQDQIELGLTYEMQNPIVVNGVLAPSIALLYYDENGKEYAAILLQSEHPGAKDDCSFKISDFSTDGSQGEFEGVVFATPSPEDLSKRTAVLITEGKFFLPNFVSNL